MSISVITHMEAPAKVSDNGINNGYSSENLATIVVLEMGDFTQLCLMKFYQSPLPMLLQVLIIINLWIAKGQYL